MSKTQNAPEHPPEHDFSWKRAAAGLAGFFILLAIFIVVGKSIGFDRAREAIATLGIWGPIAYIALVLIGFVFAPLSGNVIYLAGGVLFGQTGGFVYSVIGALLGCIADFWIARLYGRRIVEFIIGKRAIWELDQMLYRVKGNHQFIAITLLTPLAADFVSYAVGLTRIKFPMFLASICISQPAFLAIVMFGLVEIIQRFV